MDFSEVIAILKENPNKRFARKGWNGKGMFIYLVQGRRIDIADWNGYATEEERNKGYVEILPHIDMHTTNSSGCKARLCGWLASQTDMIQSDWYEVEDEQRWR